MATVPNTAAGSRISARDQVLDMVKGLLVVGMLIIHASNLFVQSPGIRSLVYPTFLGFVSGSWLCISGYIVGLRYRFMFARDPRRIARRLVGRGWRLVAIFVVSNVILGNLSPASCFGYGTAGDCELAQVFLIGDDRQAFEVLLGIGYLLLLAPLCLWLPARLMVALAVSLMIGLSAFEQAGHELPLLAWMLACGTAGIAIGTTVSQDAIRSTLENPSRRAVGILLAVATWIGTEMLFLSPVASNVSPLAYVPHVVSALWLLYVAGGWIARVELLRRPLTLMAHYSLLAYMGQMALLMIWFSLTQNWLGSWPAAGSFPVAAGVALSALLAGLYALAILRNRFKVVDKMYLAAFG